MTRAVMTLMQSKAEFVAIRDGVQLPKGVFSLLHLVHGAKHRLEADQNDPALRYRGAERMVAYGIVGYLALLLESGDFVDDRDPKRFFEMLPELILEAWDFLRCDEHPLAITFRKNFEGMQKHAPTDITDIAGGKIREEDKDLLVRTVGKTVDSLRLPPKLESYLSAEDGRLRQSLARYMRHVWAPLFRHTIVTPGRKKTSFHAWPARMWVVQEGASVTMIFRRRRDSLFGRKITFSGELRDKRGDEFTLAVEGISLPVALKLVAAVIAKHGQPIGSRFEPEDLVSLRENMRDKTLPPKRA